MIATLGISSWMPYAPQGVKETDDDDDDIVSVQKNTAHKIPDTHPLSVRVLKQ